MELSKLEPLYFDLKQKLQKMGLLSTIIHASPDGILFVTKEKKIFLMNQSAQNLLDISISPPANYDDIFEDEFFGFSMQIALAAPEKRQRVFLSLQKKEIEVMSAHTEGGMMLVLHDRTEIAQLERVARQAEQLKELGQMAAQLAHEIRNPLCGIEGFVSLLQQELKNPSQQKMLGNILEGTRTLNSLVTSILQYAKPLTLHFAPLDLAELVCELAAFMKEKVKPILKVKSRIISADKQRIKLALLNLIHNGWEASTSAVELILEEEALLIKDRGCGIAEDNLEKIFTPFFTTKSYGTGLGVAEAKKVIEAHGGKIEVESKLHVGTTVKLIL